MRCEGAKIHRARKSMLPDVETGQNNPAMLYNYPGANEKAEPLLKRDNSGFRAFRSRRASKVSNWNDCLI